MEESINGSAEGKIVMPMKNVKSETRERRYVGNFFRNLSVIIFPLLVFTETKIPAHVFR
jgi:hypothetical protein